MTRHDQAWVRVRAMGAGALLGKWPVTLAGAVLLLAGVAGAWLIVGADQQRRARVREALAGLAQYGLLFGFAAVAAAISARGLTGFARANMGLRGAWPLLLWAALDGAAGLCAVLLLRRAARGESAVAPRLAVWGLVAASSAFNWAHAPARPGAPEAFALMPVIAAVLFEFSLRETRRVAGRADRRVAGLGWLRPGERIRVSLLLAAEEALTAQAATRRVRVAQAARSLHRLRQVLSAGGGVPEAGGGRRGGRVRRAERHAQAALSRAGFADPAVAAEVLREAQVLSLTATLAMLDYATPRAAEQALAGLITPASGGSQVLAGAVPGLLGNGHRPGPVRLNGQPARGRVRAARDQAGEVRLVDAATALVGEARHQGLTLSQAELARQLRAGGFSIANGRLRWLTEVTGLAPGRGPR